MAGVFIPEVTKLQGCVFSPGWIYQGQPDILMMPSQVLIEKKVNLYQIYVHYFDRLSNRIPCRELITVLVLIPAYIKYGTETDSA
jgi:hypothetical protein